MGVETARFIYGGLVILLASSGLWGMLSQSHLGRKIIAFNLFQASILLFLLYFVPEKSPVSTVSGWTLNPLPLSLGLMITAVTLAVSAVLFALAVRVRRQEGNWNE